jgi:putative transport protein
MSRRAFVLRRDFPAAGSSFMQVIVELLAGSPLLLLFLVASLGFLFGQITIRGVRLGVSAVLFAGLGIGALSPTLRLPDIVWQLGLVLFVYSMGLSTGPGFFTALTRRGWKDNILVCVIVLALALFVGVVVRATGLANTTLTGLFCGALTNTPALAASLESIQHAGAENAKALSEEVIVGYSIAYPIGVIAMMAAMVTIPRFFGTSLSADATAQKEQARDSVTNCSIRMTQTRAAGWALGELGKSQNWKRITFGRIKRGSLVLLASETATLKLGDTLTCIGPPSELERVTAFLGETSGEKIDLDRSHLDHRRILVSNPDVAGQMLRSLNLPQQFGALVTRVRRGDVEFAPEGTTTLELGDIVRVLTRRENFDAVANFLGDSYRAMSEVDILSLGAGIVLGLLLGLYTVHLPGDISFSLGLAGGPLVSGLLLGRLGRTGSLVWSIPYGANQTLRQLGLVLFLAGVGTKAGFAFVSTVSSREGAIVFALGAVVSFAAAISTILLGHFLLGQPWSVVSGTAAGLQTNPAVLEFAATQSRSDVPGIHYVTVYPAATVIKIILAQLLLRMLS